MTSRDVVTVSIPIDRGEVILAVAGTRMFFLIRVVVSSEGLSSSTAI